MTEFDASAFKAATLYTIALVCHKIYQDFRRPTYSGAELRMSQASTNTCAVAPAVAAALARRSFLVGLAVTAPIAATASAEAFAAPMVSRSEIDDLYAERTKLTARSKTLKDQYRAAEDSMPWWAQPGQKYVRSDGQWIGEKVGWPAIDDGKLPSCPSIWIDKRISPHEIRNDFAIDTETARMGPVEARVRYRSRMRDMIARLRRQREEEAKAGLRQFRDRLNEIRESLKEIDKKIENSNVTAADAAQKVAAVTLIASSCDRRRSHEYLGNSATLVALQPFLTGQIREHVDYVIEHPYHEMSAMPFYSAT
jgi:hypothetical protein